MTRIEILRGRNERLPSMSSSKLQSRKLELSKPKLLASNHVNYFKQNDEPNILTCFSLRANDLHKILIHTTTIRYMFPSKKIQIAAPKSKLLLPHTHPSCCHLSLPPILTTSRPLPLHTHVAPAPNNLPHLNALWTKALSLNTFISDATACKFVSINFTINSGILAKCTNPG